jgi:hypothetical protein
MGSLGYVPRARSRDSRPSRSAGDAVTCVRDGTSWLCVQAQTTVVLPQHAATPESVVSVDLLGVKQPQSQPHH